MEKIRAVMMDLDGTVYRGNEPVEGSLELIAWFRSNGINVYFTTNNSEKSRTKIAEKLTHMGVNCEKENIVSSGFVSAVYAKNAKLDKVYVCGTENLRDEFRGQGVPITDAENARNMVIGMDYGFDYAKLTDAVRAAMNSDKIIACNKERIFPREGGKLFPGCGGMVIPIEYCAERHVDIVVGKPSLFMFDYVKERESLNSNQILVIGDSMESDVEMAQMAGAPFIFIDDFDGISMENALNFCKVEYFGKNNQQIDK